MGKLRSGAKSGEKEGGVTSLSAPKNPGGRPSGFKSEFCLQAAKLCRLGATDKELADFFEVDETTVNRWKKDFPEFCLSIKEGKSLSDAEVADKLFKRATGYEHKETKVFLHEGAPVLVDVEKHYPPDATSAIFWLKNRRPDLWREKIDPPPNSGEEEVIKVNKDTISED